MIVDGKRNLFHPPNSLKRYPSRSCCHRRDALPLSAFTSKRACLPGIPGYPHDEPGCFNRTFFQWIKDSLAVMQPHIEKIGISYVYGGAWVPDKSGHGSKGGEFHVGPHIMIVSPHENQSELESFSRDGSDGMPYVTHLPNGTDLFLVIPIRQADDKRAK
jgi:hypothetical protein